MLWKTAFFFLACGYLKAESYTLNEETGADLYELAVTNKEVQTFHGETAGEVLPRFCAGLAVELADRYIITSNQKSGFGRYDVMLEPKYGMTDAVIMESKVRDSKKEKSLEDTADTALRQIAEVRIQNREEGLLRYLCIYVWNCNFIW